MSFSPLPLLASPSVDWPFKLRRNLYPQYGYERAVVWLRNLVTKKRYHFSNSDRPVVFEAIGLESKAEFDRVVKNVELRVGWTFALMSDGKNGFKFATNERHPLTDLVEGTEYEAIFLTEANYHFAQLSMLSSNKYKLFILQKRSAVYLEQFCDQANVRMQSKSPVHEVEIRETVAPPSSSSDSVLVIHSNVSRLGTPMPAPAQRKASPIADLAAPMAAHKGNKRPVLQKQAAIEMDDQDVISMKRKSDSKSDKVDDAPLDLSVRVKKGKWL